MKIEVSINIMHSFNFSVTSPAIPVLGKRTVAIQHMNFASCVVNIK